MSGTVGATTLTVEQIAKHKHELSYDRSNRAGSGYIAYLLNGGTMNYETKETGGSQPHTHALTGASGEASSLPPYYALDYIMRCA